MQNDLDTVALGLQLGSAALLVVIITLTHASGLIAITRALNLQGERLEEHEFNMHAVFLMAGMALLLFMLHMVEIALFAGFYLLVGALDGIEEALSFSASTYATLGRTEEFFPQEWRLLSAIESLIGFLMIGWSTAFIVSRVNKLRRG